MFKLVKVFPVEIGKEGFPFKKQQESQMKVFVQKLRIRFNLLLWRWCSKSLWIRFLLQIHHNFEVLIRSEVFWGKNVAEFPFCWKNSRGDDFNINPRNTVAAGCIALFFYSCLQIQYTGTSLCNSFFLNDWFENRLRKKNLSLRLIPPQKRNFLSLPM